MNTVACLFALCWACFSHFLEPKSGGHGPPSPPVASALHSNAIRLLTIDTADAWQLQMGWKFCSIKCPVHDIVHSSTEVGVTLTPPTAKSSSMMMAGVWSVQWCSGASSQTSVSDSWATCEWFTSACLSLVVYSKLHRWVWKILTILRVLVRLQVWANL